MLHVPDPREQGVHLIEPQRPLRIRGHHEPVAQVEAGGTDARTVGQVVAHELRREEAPVERAHPRKQFVVAALGAERALRQAERLRRAVLRAQESVDEEILDFSGRDVRESARRVVVVLRHMQRIAVRDDRVERRAQLPVFGGLRGAGEDQRDERAHKLAVHRVLHRQSRVGSRSHRARAPSCPPG